MKSYHIIVIGAKGVGKSAIIRQFVESFFREGYKPMDNIDNYDKPIMHMDEECLIETYDVNGEVIEDSPSLTDFYLRRISDGFVLVYSLIDYSSFEYIKTIREKIVNLRGTEEVPMVLVGNKGDLALDSRAVETSIAAELAATWPNCRFIETSARNHDEIESVFKHCLDAIEELRHENQQQKGKKKMKIGKCSIM